jgi:hypothetical protein
MDLWWEDTQMSLDDAPSPQEELTASVYAEE